MTGTAGQLHFDQTTDSVKQPNGNVSQNPASAITASMFFNGQKGLEAVSKPDCRYFNGREFAFV